MEPIKRYLTHLINWFIENPKHSFYLLIRINFLLVYTHRNMFFRVVKFNVSFKLEFLFQNVVKITSISSFEWHQNKLLRCLTNLLQNLLREYFMIIMNYYPQLILIKLNLLLIHRPKVFYFFLKRHHKNFKQ